MKSKQISKQMIFERQLFSVPLTYEKGQDKLMLLDIILC